MNEGCVFGMAQLMYDTCTSVVKVLAHDYLRCGTSLRISEPKVRRRSPSSLLVLPFQLLLRGLGEGFGTGERGELLYLLN